MGLLHRGIAALLVVSVIAVPASAELATAESLVVGFQALGASSLAKELYAVELLRWGAIAELVNESLPATRLSAWAAALDGLRHAASAYDRDPTTNEQLADSVRDLDALMQAPPPFAQPGEAQRWSAIRSATAQQVTRDALRLFANRTSTEAGIASLRLGLGAEAWLGNPSTSLLRLLADSEQDLLDRDLGRAADLEAAAGAAHDGSASRYNPLRMAVLAAGKNKAQQALEIYQRHGAVDAAGRVSALVGQLDQDIQSTRGPWVVSLLATTVALTALWGVLQVRVSAWHATYGHARRANFLMGVER